MPSIDIKRIFWRLGFASGEQQYSKVSYWSRKEAAKSEIWVRLLWKLYWRCDTPWRETCVTVE